MKESLYVNTSNLQAILKVFLAPIFRCGFDNKIRVNELDKFIDYTIDIYTWQYDLITEYFDLFK